MGFFPSVGLSGALAAATSCATTATRIATLALLCAVPDFRTTFSGAGPLLSLRMAQARSHNYDRGPPT